MKAAGKEGRDKMRERARAKANARNEVRVGWGKSIKRFDPLPEPKKKDDEEESQEEDEKEQQLQLSKKQAQKAVKKKGAKDDKKDEEGPDPEKERQREQALAAVRLKQEEQQVVALKVDNNKLKSLEGLDKALEQVAGKQPIKLRWVDASHNQLPGIPTSLLRWNCLRGLVVLNLNGNNIATVKQVQSLRVFTRLSSLSLIGNPVEEVPRYRWYTIGAIASLRKLDCICITPHERDYIEQWWNEPTASGKKRRGRMPDLSINTADANSSSGKQNYIRYWDGMGKGTKAGWSPNCTGTMGTAQRSPVKKAW
jgi:hypothetical protein